MYETANMKHQKAWQDLLFVQRENDGKRGSSIAVAWVEEMKSPKVGSHHALKDSIVKPSHL